MKKLTFNQRAKDERRRRALAAALSLSVIGGTMAGVVTGAGASDLSASDGISVTEQAEINSVDVVNYTVEPRSSIPAGTRKVGLIINGRRVLDGKVFHLNGSTYVPMFAFADWQGNFNYTYNKSTRTATVSGINLEISATVGKLYILANGRYFYTENQVILHNGEVCVPILTMVKALNGRLEWSSADNAFTVRSGDTRKLKSASQVYNDDEVYWLARIISAESGAEPMKGKIAVGNVVLNRVRSQYFPNTIYGVIFDKKFGVQFAPVSNGTIYKTPTAESIIAAKICLEGYSLSNDILYFMNPDNASSSWISQNRPYAFRIGNHVFYK